MAKKKATQNDTDKAAWGWTAEKRRAAVLVAEDELTDLEIAAELSISRPTLARWKRAAEFAQQVKAHVEEFGRLAERYAVGRKSRRIAAIDERWRRLRQVMLERGEAMAGVPGGSTGLLVRRLKVIGSGEYQQTVEEYELDGVLLREAREHEKAAAVELGQLPKAAEAAQDEEPPLFDREE